MRELRETVAEYEERIGARVEPASGSGVDLHALRLKMAREELAKLEAEHGTGE
jgi:hypothetical protein